jgi:hypothetical protein
MVRQAISTTERGGVRTEPRQFSRSAAAFADHRPGAAALRKLSDAMHDSPRMAAQRQLAETMHAGPRVAAQRKLGEALSAATAQRNNAAPVQRTISVEHDEEGEPYKVDRVMTVSEVMRELVENFEYDDDYDVREVLFEFDERNAIFYDIAELAEVLQDRLRGGASDEEEDDDLGETTSFYHGTDLVTARLLESGAKIDARGKGELGGGFYMTHDLHQAAHIGDYYTGKEGRGPKWGVVLFSIPTVALQGPLKNREVVTPDEFEAYYQQVKENSNKKQSEFDWTIGPIKDNTTPYVQHLFASGGLAVLNDKATKRKLVLSGDVGVDYGKYWQQVKGYKQSKDKILKAFLEMEPDQEDSGGASQDSNEEVDYEYLEGRVKSAKSANNKRLTQNVIEELQEALESAPKDEMLTKWLAELT